MKSNHNLQPTPYTLTLGWLYPDLMSTYGDRGNIIVLQKRCAWRGIEAKIEQITVGNDDQRLKAVDFILMGGAEDRQQEIVGKDLQAGKDNILIDLIEKGIPGLYICGAYQFLGKYYKDADGAIIDGLGIFDVYTKNPGIHHPRLIGNIVTEVDTLPEPKSWPAQDLVSRSPKILDQTLTSHPSPLSLLIGFENHGGRTYLGKGAKPFTKVVKGFGNNGKDGTEGAVYKNSFGTYMHGPILSKNPLFADFLIKLALENKYQSRIELEDLDDSLENQARDIIASNL